MLTQILTYLLVKKKINFTELDLELLYIIFSYLTFNDGLRLAQVNKKIRDLNDKNSVFLSNKISILNNKIASFEYKVHSKNKQLALQFNSSLLHQKAVVSPMGIHPVSNPGPDFSARFFIRQSISRNKKRIGQCHNALDSAHIKKSNINNNDDHLEVHKKVLSLNH